MVTSTGAARPPNDGVHLPVADARALLNKRRALVDHHLILQPAPAFRAAAPLAVGLGGLAQVGVEIAARLLLAVNVLVEGLVADVRHAGIEADVAADLFGAPLPFAQLFLGAAKGFDGHGTPFPGFKPIRMILGFGD
jgi:hypothetical protein